MSHDEKLQIIEKALRFVNGRVPVIAGTGGNNTAETIRFSQEVEALGVDGLLVVSPYYNKPTQDGLYAHFTAVARAVSCPIILYNIPGRTAVNIEVETMLRLFKEPNIVGVKESSGDFGFITKLLAAKPDGITIWSGDDKFTLPMMSLGAYGVVSVASHVVGEEMSQMIEAYVNGEVGAATDWHNRLMPVFEGLFRVSNPAPVKAALSMLNLTTPTVRLPLLPAPEFVVDEVREALTVLGKL